MTCVATRLANAGQTSRAGSDPQLAVSPLDDWSVVETTTGRYVVGELLIRNTGLTPLELMELRLDESTSPPSLLRFGASELLSRLANTANSAPSSSLTLVPNDSVFCFLWERLAGEVNIRSAALDFRSNGMLGGTRVPLAAPRVEVVRLAPPLAGGPWGAVYDPTVPRSHRRVAFAYDDRLVVPARFAIDWIRLDDSGRPTDAAPTEFARWYGFGADVLAVADAKVVAVRDSYPDVLTTDRPQKRSEDDVSGNYIGLALPSGQFAFYEHLQRGSVRVKVGDTVSAGQPIARLGRSGINSAGPHLHFHVGTAPSTLDSQGRPFALSQFRLLGGYPSMSAALGGTRWSNDTSSSPSRVVRNLLPSANAVVMLE